MFDGKRSRRDCLLPIAVALIVAMVGAFGWAAASATAKPAADVTSQTTAVLTVGKVETGVEGTAYKYMDMKWDDQVGQPVDPVRVFAPGAVDWVRKYFPSYIGTDDEPTADFINLSAEGTRDFADRLLAAIQAGTVRLPSTESDFSNFIPTSADDDAIIFKLAMGGYVIKLGNGSKRVYQPIMTFVKPQWDEGAEGYRLEVKDVDGGASNEARAKSKVIESTKTVHGKLKTHGQIGEDLLYQIKTPIPHYPTHATNQRFGVQDSPGPGLSIRQDSVRVKIEGDADLPTSAYSVTEIPADATHSAGIKVEFSSNQYREKLAMAGKIGKSLIVEYTGSLNDKAPIKDGTSNSAWPLLPKSIYDSEGGEYTSPPPPAAVTTVYTYGIRATKVMKGNGNILLSGATFELYKQSSGKSKSSKKKDARDATAVKVKQAAGTTGADASGKYIVHPEGTSAIISGKDGTVQIDGLGAGTYELKEVRAPNGYTLPANPITTITIRDDNRNDGSDGKPAEPDGKPDTTSMVNGGPATLDASDNRITFKIENRRADFKLPETGAMGAAVFAVIGMALVAISSVLVIIRRRARRSS
ncbi:SpaH/EbpB family LPXTG-anchored major pilin [Bifidobacterium panos]|uniref:SpaA-like prealbumin fold domain-containing protein n=1 Tax=Bifidobacterium panos TaxID=2675321 RepID=A0ABX1SVX2_9BIFI|nr:SpaH/EbpB family LPXTG-anchored major pilin [Bifidobacterium sp. DSM 109963]NMN01996.1 hypothetical protein [Bifidobacterium sp. DSM 109963]